MVLCNTQKWTLAYIWYAVFACIWYEICWHAYNTLLSRTYDTHLPHDPNPTHRVAYSRQSPFLRINTTSFRFLFGVLYTHFHEIGLERGGCMLLTTEALKIVPKLGHVLIASLLDVYFLCARGHALLEDKAREVPQCCEWVILRLL